jgi:hypothetical protein
MITAPEVAPAGHLSLLSVGDIGTRDQTRDPSTSTTSFGMTAWKTHRLISPGILQPPLVSDALDLLSHARQP